MGLFCTLDLPKPIPMKNKLIQGINFSAGGFLFILGIMGYIYPEWFFQEKYDVLMPTPQSTTILQVMMGFMATIGLLWLWATRYLSEQRRFLKATGVMTLGFVLSRIGGLILDGWNQTFTYRELAFEVLALMVIFVMLVNTSKDHAKN